MAGGLEPDRDPGLQAERTSLAWSRTLLAYLVVGALALKSTPTSGAAGLVGALACATVAAVIALGRTPRYRRDLRRMGGGHGSSPVAEVLALGVLTSTLAAYSLVVVLL